MINSTIKVGTEVSFYYRNLLEKGVVVSVERRYRELGDYSGLVYGQSYLSALKNILVIDNDYAIKVDSEGNEVKYIPIGYWYSVKSKDQTHLVKISEEDVISVLNEPKEYFSKMNARINYKYTKWLPKQRKFKTIDSATTEVAIDSIDQLREIIKDFAKSNNQDLSNFILSAGCLESKFDNRKKVFSLFINEISSSYLLGDNSYSNEFFKYLFPELEVFIQPLNAHKYLESDVFSLKK